jgi:hypothetical protein
MRILVLGVRLSAVPVAAVRSAVVFLRSLLSDSVRSHSLQSVLVEEPDVLLLAGHSGLLMQEVSLPFYTCDK